MKFEIHNDKYEDFFVVECENMDQIMDVVIKEMKKRSWKEDDCWSREIS